MPDAMPGLAPGIRDAATTSMRDAKSRPDAAGRDNPAMMAGEARPSRKFELAPRVILLSDVFAPPVFGGAAPVRLT